MHSYAYGISMIINGGGGGIRLILFSPSRDLSLEVNILLGNRVDNNYAKRQVWHNPSVSLYEISLAAFIRSKMP